MWVLLPSSRFCVFAFVSNWSLGRCGTARRSHDRSYFMMFETTDYYQAKGLILTQTCLSCFHLLLGAGPRLELPPSIDRQTDYLISPSPFRRPVCTALTQSAGRPSSAVQACTRHNTKQAASRSFPHILASCSFDREGGSTSQNNKQFTYVVYVCM